MKTKKLWLTFIAGLLLTGFVGCKDENVEKVGVCPVVVLTTPGTAQANVERDRNITITFNEPLNPATITPAAFTLMRANATEVSGALVYNSEKAMITFTPD